MRTSATSRISPQSHGTPPAAAAGKAGDAQAFALLLGAAPPKAGGAGDRSAQDNAQDSGDQASPQAQDNAGTTSQMPVSLASMAGAGASADADAQSSIGDASAVATGTDATVRPTAGKTSPDKTAVKTTQADKPDTDDAAGPQPLLMVAPPQPVVSATQTQAAQPSEAAPTGKAAAARPKPASDQASDPQPPVMPDQSLRPVAPPAPPSPLQPAASPATTAQAAPAAQPIGATGKGTQPAGVKSDPAALKGARKTDTESQDTQPSDDVKPAATADATPAAAKPAPSAGGNTADMAVSAPQAPAAAATPSSAAPAMTQHVQVGAHAPNLPALAVQITARSQSGARQFDIRLDPPELGHVEVRLSIDATGKASAHLSADQPQTLDLLQKDAASLTRALRDAGLDVAQDGLNFSLRQQSQQGGGQDSNQDSNGRGFARGTSFTATTSIDATAASAQIRAPADGRLDIRV